MSLTTELQIHSSLNSELEIEGFSETIKKMAITQDKKYIPIILSYLNDNSEHTDVMKEIVGMAETFYAKDYVGVILDEIKTLKLQSSDWLEYITYRITNSKIYIEIYRDLLKKHQNREIIINYLMLFSKKTQKNLNK